MQRFHIDAPKGVDKGNRLTVSIPTLGKVQIDFPLYSAVKQPIQFHLPVVCEHHLNKKLAPNCHVVQPVRPTTNETMNSPFPRRARAHRRGSRQRGIYRSSESLLLPPPMPRSRSRRWRSSIATR